MFKCIILILGTLFLFSCNFDANKDPKKLPEDKSKGKIKNVTNKLDSVDAYSFDESTIKLLKKLIYDYEKLPADYQLDTALKMKNAIAFFKQVENNLKVLTDEERKIFREAQERLEKAINDSIKFEKSLGKNDRKIIFNENDHSLIRDAGKLVIPRPKNCSPVEFKKYSKLISVEDLFRYKSQIFDMIVGVDRFYISNYIDSLNTILKTKKIENKKDIKKYYTALSRSQFSAKLKPIELKDRIDKLIKSFHKYTQNKIPLEKVTEFGRKSLHCYWGENVKFNNMVNYLVTEKRGEWLFKNMTKEQLDSRKNGDIFPRDARPEGGIFNTILDAWGRSYLLLKKEKEYIIYSRGQSVDDADDDIIIKKYKL